MRGDRVRASQLGNDRCMDGIRLFSSAGLPNGRDMIDIDT
jgi:hypothetical protein